MSPGIVRNGETINNVNNVNNEYFGPWFGSHGGVYTKRIYTDLRERSTMCGFTDLRNSSILSFACLSLILSVLTN